MAIFDDITNKVLDARHLAGFWMPAGLWLAVTAAAGIAMAWISRAILRDAPVLVLDEPTAGLDAASAWQVMGLLGRLMAGRTTILITHDMALARQADDILVLDLAAPLAAAAR